MENQDPVHEIKPERLGSRKKVQGKNLSLKNKFPIEKRDKISSLGDPEDFTNNSKENENSSVTRNSASTSDSRNSNNVTLTEKNDSLCDFRSPARDDEMDDSLADFRIKPTVLKANKRSARKEIKPVVSKKRRNRNPPLNVNQPSIASSFFKPQTIVETAFPCPLCFKPYKDATAQHNHMKSCAAKNKISTDKLLDAVQLQEKQARERKAMGLLAAPPIQQKKTISKKLISDKDPQLQLALALSMSLHEAQVNEEFQDAHLLAGEPCIPINAEMSEERRQTLQNFGFTTNKPVTMTASTSKKSRKKRPTGPTALQMRTQEERDRLLTVRIAEALMGDEAITQALLVNEEKVTEAKNDIVLKSRLLRSYHCMEDRLWDKSQQCLSGRSPYSCNLVEVSPCKVKPEPKIYEPEPGPSNQPDIPVETVRNVSDVVNASNKSVPKKLETASGNSVVVKQQKATEKKCNADETSLMNLSKDWACMEGASYMSDVLVIVKGGVEMYAHRTVFWARCYDILSDMTEHDSEKLSEIKYKILWPETDSFSAYAFLEYIYRGIIEKWVKVFDHPDALAGVRVLARKYRLKKLFVYLRDKGNELSLEKIENSNKFSNAETNSKLNNFDDDLSQLSVDESSISSVETDINSVSTACNDPSLNKQAIDERSSDSDNLSRKNMKSMNVKEKEDISNDSSSSEKVGHERRSSGKRRSEIISVNDAAAINDTIDNKNSEKSSLSPSRKNRDTIDKSHTNVEPMNQTSEDDRCTSPDIFDDSITASSAYACTVSKERQCLPKRDKNCSDSNVEFGSANSKNSRIESPELIEKSYKMKDAGSFEGRNSGKSDKSRVNFSFVTTHRGGRISKADNSNSESNHLDIENKASGSTSEQKGEITMAIERIQRLNTKTASESDSECESVETFQIKRHKNPFRINATDTSSMIDEKVRHDPPHASETDIPSKRRNKLSIFEKKIELEADKNPAMFNLTSFKPVSDVHTQKRESPGNSKSKTNFRDSQNTKYDRKNEVEIEDRIEPSQKHTSKLDDDTVEAFFDLTQESSRESKLDSEEESFSSTTHDKDLSMFSKYKKRHRHNSIDKYRAALKNIIPRTLIANNKDKNEVSSSDDLMSSDDEIFDTNIKTKRNTYSSKYEYTDLDQSTSNLHRELSNTLANSQRQRTISPQILSSTESDGGEQTPAKPEDVELSDLEIDLSEFSNIQSSNRSDNTRVDSKIHDSSTSKRKSACRISDDEQRLDSLVSIKFEDTDSAITKNDSGNKKANISDQDTDTDCYIESISTSGEPKTTGNIKKRSDEDKSSDIYNEETDTGEMEDKHYNPRYSRSKMGVDTALDAVPEEKSKSQSPNVDHLEFSSPDYKIPGVFSPLSTTFDFVSNVTNEVENLLDECRAGSQRYHDLQTNLNDCNSRATTSGLFMSASTPCTKNNNHNDINLLNGVSDSEFDDIVLPINNDSSKGNSQNTELDNSISAEAEKRGKTVNQQPEESYLILDSDSSYSGSPTIHKTKSNASILSANRSKMIRKRSRHKSVTPERSSESPLRTFKVKSMSENIMRTNSISRGNVLDDSFDGEFARIRTPPPEEQDTRNNKDQRTPQQSITAENVTPLADYSAMKTPELSKELQKYGLKAQKRHRAKQLLRHIYNVQHPLVPVNNERISSSDESSSEDNRPPPKRLYRSNSFEAISGIHKNTNKVDSNCETLASDTGKMSDASNGKKKVKNKSNESESLGNIFRNLIHSDRSLHNKILTYEPIVLEELHATLESQGFKFKLDALQDFLDEQCITFRTLANKNRTRRKASSKESRAAGAQ